MINLPMLLSDKNNAYSVFCSKLAKNRLQTIGESPVNISVVEELLCFQTWLSDNITPFFGHHNHQQDPAGHVCHSKYSNNLSWAHCSLQALENGLYAQSASCMRTIMESIPWLFYTTLCSPDELMDIFLKHKIDNVAKEEKSQTIMQFLCDAKQDCHDNVDNVRKRIANKYHFKWYLRQLYDQARRNRICEQYQLLSVATHGHIIDCDMLSPTYDKNTARTLMFLLKDMLYYNLIIEIQNNKDVIIDNGFVSDCNEFLTYLNTEIFQEKNPYSMIPNRFNEKNINYDIFRGLFTHK